MSKTKYEPKLEEVFSSYVDSYGNRRELFFEDTALAKLLVDGILFVGDSDSGPFFETDKPREDATICVYLNCNDLFAWGCADYELVTTFELRELYKMHIEDPEWGSVKWASKKRNLQPLKPVVKQMKEAGVWCSLMESLPTNP